MRYWGEVDRLHLVSQDGLLSLAHLNVVSDHHQQLCLLPDQGRLEISNNIRMHNLSLTVSRLSESFKQAFHALLSLDLAIALWVILDLHHLDLCDFFIESFVVDQRFLVFRIIALNLSHWWLPQRTDRCILVRQQVSTGSVRKVYGWQVLFQDHNAVRERLQYAIHVLSFLWKVFNLVLVLPR